MDTEASRPQARFRETAIYARKVLSDPLQREVYRALAAARKKPVNAILITDYLNQPEVVRIETAGYTGAAGQATKVQAFDDIEDVAVSVAINDVAGVLLEEGAALGIHGISIYRTRLNVSAQRTLGITANATDRSGHEDTLTIDHP